MSASPSPLPPAEKLRLEKLGILPVLFPVLGIVGLASAFTWGLLSNHAQLAFSYLFAFTVGFTICSGALFWTLLHHALDADWSVLVRRILETVASCFPVILLLALPILFLFPKELWHWMTADVAHDPLLGWKRPFLNEPFFYIRCPFYLLFFCAAALLDRRWSMQQDEDGDPRLTLRSRHTAYGFIPLFVLCFTFAGFDWLMALDHHWYSTMWGVYLFAGAAQSSMALLILITNGLVRTGHLRGLFTAEHNHLMGMLLFAFTVFWGYISFSQYFLQWYANIPEETWFFVYRNTGTWFYFSIFLVIGHFFVPFILLLTQPAKRTPWRICTASAWVLLMHCVDLYWIIMPNLQLQEARHAGLKAATTGFHPHPIDFLALVGVVGILGHAFLWLFSRGSIFPARDPRLRESLGVTNWS
jgi:hypothetical protein